METELQVAQAAGNQASHVENKNLEGRIPTPYKLIKTLNLTTCLTVLGAIIIVHTGINDESMQEWKELILNALSCGWSCLMSTDHWDKPTIHCTTDASTISQALLTCAVTWTSELYQRVRTWITSELHHIALLAYIWTIWLVYVFCPQDDGTVNKPH